MVTGVATSECNCEECVCGLNDSPEFFSPERAEYTYAMPKGDRYHYFLMPEFRFNCHGTILNWTILVAYNNIAEGTGLTRIHLWRPHNGGYRPISSVSFQLDTESESNVDYIPSDESISFYKFSRTENWTFQPGDILGLYVHIDGAFKRLFVTYHNYSMDTDFDQYAVDMYYYKRQNAANTDTIFSLSAKDAIIPSVVPHIYFHSIYG